MLQLARVEVEHRDVEAKDAGFAVDGDLLAGLVRSSDGSQPLQRIGFVDLCAEPGGGRDDMR